MQDERIVINLPNTRSTISPNQFTVAGRKDGLLLITPHEKETSATLIFLPKASGNELSSSLKSLSRTASNQET
jgi:hypothetical protein